MVAMASGSLELETDLSKFGILSGPGLFIHTMLMGSIFSILLITMILMAVCVYKPIRRR